MHNMYNLGTVVKFEVMRMLKKFSFWAMALGFPLMFAAIFGIIFWSNQATMEATKKLQEQDFKAAIVDDSGVVSSQLAEQMKLEKLSSKDQGIQRVKDGSLDGFIYFPANLEQNTVQAYGKDVGMFQNSRYSAVAETLLTASIDAKVDPQSKAILQKKVKTETTTYRNGVEFDGVKEMIVPGFFLVLFYMLIAFFGGQMLNSTVEEKENRTVEMLLTTVKAKTLITGKILAMISLALIQGLVIILPVLVLYFTLGQKLHMPALDLSNVVFDPVRIGIALGVFATGFMMFTGLLVAVGAMMPTAKEASSWFSIVLVALFAPLYGFSVFVSYPDSPFVQFFSYFPLTSPIPLLLRNAVGNLQVYEAAIAVAILAVSAFVAVVVAVKLFRYGAMQYDSKLSLSVLRARRDEAAKS